MEYKFEKQKTPADAMSLTALKNRVRPEELKKLKSITLPDLTKLLLKTKEAQSDTQANQNGDSGTAWRGGRKIWRKE